MSGTFLGALYITVNKTEKIPDCLGLPLQWGIERQTVNNILYKVEQGEEDGSVGSRAGTQAADLMACSGKASFRKEDLKEMGILPLSGGRTFQAEKTTGANAFRKEHLVHFIWCIQSEEANLTKVK